MKYNINNWEKMFNRRILDRGYEYYIGDFIVTYDQSEECIKALVNGSENYEVNITLCDGEITNMSCTCPYAEDGNYCKHMAAVLYNWSNNPKEHLCIDDIDELIKEANSEEKNAFLKNILSNDSDLLLKFKKHIRKTIDKNDLTSLKKKIDMITYGHHGFIDYYHAYDFYIAIMTVIDENIDFLLNNGEYDNAFELLNCILDNITDVDIDDSDGYLYDIAECIYEVWKQMSDAASFDEQKKMFKWFTDNLDGRYLDYGDEFIFKVIVEGFNDCRFIKDKLTFMKDRIKKLSRSNDEYREYELKNCIITYLNMLDLYDESKEEIERIKHEYWYLDVVRDRFIDLSIKNGDYKKALMIIDECIDSSSKNGGYGLSKYHLKKKEVYELSEDMDNLKRELFELVTIYKPCDLELYKELKGLYDNKTWLDISEKIIDACKNESNICFIYAEEKKYDLLMDFLKKETRMYLVREFEDILKNDYSKEILEIYENYLENEARYASGRKAYQGYVHTLEHMKSFEGGHACVAKIVTEWQNVYANRKAMMEELGKLK